MNTNVDLNKVPVPPELDDKQAKRARDFVEGTILKGMKQAEFCKQYNISSGTLHSERHLKNVHFSKYVQQLTHECIGKDDIESHQIIMKRIQQNAMMPNASTKDIDLYNDFYSWMFKFYEATKLKELNVTTEGDSRTVEEKKLSLLSRLKGDDTE